jgi:aminopeptidase N
MRQPMTTWLATVHVNKFTSNFSRAPDDTPIRVYASPGTPPEDVPKYALAGRMLTHFERLIGPYPFDSYGSAIVDDPELFYALETQAMSTFPVDVHGSADFVSHELAHQWFGNSVSVKRWEDLWLAEGPATFFEFVWAHRNDPAAFEAAMRNNYAFVVQQGFGSNIVQDPVDLFDPGIYYRGAATLYALQLEVGKPTFYRILKTFLTVYRYRNVTSEDFIRTAVFVSRDGSVRELLEAWIYEEPVPPLPGMAVATAPRGPVERPDIVGPRHRVRATAE